MKTVTVEFTDAQFELIKKVGGPLRASPEQLVQALSLAALDMECDPGHETFLSISSMLYDFGVRQRLPREIDPDCLLNYEQGNAPSAEQMEVDHAL